ncbi:MAG: glycosyltransferase [Alphaproteobacteria bacterium]|nr:glycosyltransferase [Alphaproteobacteria bacterium]
MTTPPPVKPLHILAWPAYSNKMHNPYNFLLCSALESSGCKVVEFSYQNLLRKPFNILHYHWPDSFVAGGSLPKTIRRMMILIAILIITRLKGARSVWTVHNLMPHDNPNSKFILSFLKLFARACDGLIFLSNSSLKECEAVYGTLNHSKIAIIPHGHYRDMYPSRLTKESALSQLGLGEHAHKTILLFFGKIRSYKNVEALINSFQELKRPNDVLLLIAGSAENPTYKEKIHNLVQDSPSILLHEKFIPDEDIPLFFGAADVAVLPYKHILNSGSAILSLGFDCPVLVPSIGSMPELQKDVGTDAVHLYDGELSPEKLEDMISYCTKRSRDQPISLERYDWPVIANQLVSFFTRLNKK